MVFICLYLDLDLVHGFWWVLFRRWFVFCKRYPPFETEQAYTTLFSSSLV
jgi:hypothetical protein